MSTSSAVDALLTDRLYIFVAQIGVLQRMCQISDDDFIKAIDLIANKQGFPSGDLGSFCDKISKIMDNNKLSVDDIRIIAAKIILRNTQDCDFSKLQQEYFAAFQSRLAQSG